MKDTGIGRLLVASLHQAISEILPTRLDFYENWLNSEGLRHGRIGLAPLGAVLSFLREEGEAYDRVTARAGELAADWTLQGLPSYRVSLVRSLPNWLRARAVGWLARGIASRIYLASRAHVRWRRGIAVMNIRPSVFCGIRGKVMAPLCRFYAASLSRLLERFGLGADVQVTSCRATGGSGCSITAVVLNSPVADAGRQVGLSIVVLLMILGFAEASTLAQAPERQASARTTQAAADRILVVPFDNINREARIYWLKEASAVALTDDLVLLGATALSRDERVRAFERLQLPVNATLTHATVIKVGQLLGAANVVTGTLSVSDGILTVRARRIQLDTGRAQADIVERGPLTDLFAIFDRLAGALQLAPFANKVALEGSHPPLPAFEGYIKGLLAETPTTQVTFLESALTLYPRYDAARLALWDAHTAQGHHARALAVALSVDNRSPSYSRAQFFAALSLMALPQYPEAFTTLKALVDARPTPAVLNALGVVQLRRGATPQTGRATYYFNKAAEVDPDDPDYVFNLGYAYAVEHDLPAAIYWLRETVRRNPADGDAHAVLAWVLQASGAVAEAVPERELAERLSTGSPGRERKAGTGGEVLPRGLERITESFDEPTGPRIDSAIVATEQRDQRELVAFYLDRGRRLFAAQRDGEAITELKRAVYLSPYQAEAQLLLGRIYLRTNRVREAIDALKISVWSENTAAAHVALGEAHLQAKDPDAARAELQRALTLDPDSADAKRLLAKLPPQR